MSVITIPTPPAPAPASPESRPARIPNLLELYFSCVSDLTTGPSPWNRTAIAAIISLVALWAARFYSTWATWGTLAIDSGREMYVPAMLAQGKMLYRDVWFGYTPLAPYLNAFLFRSFGIHLNVLYWAGSLAALGCALLLFLSGKRLSSPLAGWTAGAIVLMEAFHAWHFSFPLAYSFSSVYGCVAACAFLWCAVHASRSTKCLWMFAAATAAAAALLFKIEFGAASYAVYFLLVAARARQRRDWKSVGGDFAVSLPGLLICALVLRWMILIGGPAFITQENLANTWPWSFLMTTYGELWFEKTGLAVTTPVLLQVFFRAVFLAGGILEGYLLFWSRRHTARGVLLQIAVFGGLFGYFVFVLQGHPFDALSSLFFPQDMVFYVAIGALFASWHARVTTESRSLLPIATVLTFAVLVALRTLFKTTPWGYSIYYNGPAVLSFLILVRPMVPRASRPRRTVLRGELLLCLGCLAVAAVYSSRFSADFSDRVALTTDRGTIIVQNQVAENYRASIRLMKQEAAAGRMVLSVPEDTSLYFLSGTEAPSRLFCFVPGVLVPGKMTEDLIREIDQKPIRYVLWSNRSFPDYGVPRFGTDFDQTLGNYLTSHYQRRGLLVPPSDLEWQTRFTLWERKTDSQPQ